MGRGLVAELVDLLLRGFRLQERVVDVTRQVCRLDSLSSAGTAPAGRRRPLGAKARNNFRHDLLNELVLIHYSEKPPRSRAMILLIRTICLPPPNRVASHTRAISQSWPAS